jgi:hypothetical protein
MAGYELSISVARSASRTRPGPPDAGSRRGSQVAKKSPGDVAIDKFDILATFANARALLDGLDHDEVKQRGMVAAIMGAKARLGNRGGSNEDDYKADKDAAERKKRM